MYHKVGVFEEKKVHGFWNVMRTEATLEAGSQNNDCPRRCFGRKTAGGFPQVFFAVWFFCVHCWKDFGSL